MSDSETKTKPRFDLSDGLGKEDISAIVHGIWYLFILILKIILWPYIWLFRQFGRTLRFLRRSHDEPLNDSERQFLESIPLFFTVIGLLGGFAVAILAIIGLSEELDKFFEDFKLEEAVEDFAGGIAAIGGAIWAVLVFIGSLIVGFFEFCSDVFEGDPFLALLGISVLGVILIIGYFALSETGLISKMLGQIGSIGQYARNAPTVVWNTLNGAYLRFNHFFAGIVIGKGRFDKYSQKFFHKTLIATVALGIYTFLAGIVLLASRDFDSNEERVIFLSFSLFVLGVITGVVELAFLTRVLDLISRNKYLASTP